MPLHLPATEAEHKVQEGAIWERVSKVESKRAQRQSHAKVSLDYSAQFQKETARCRARAVSQVYLCPCGNMNSELNWDWDSSGATPADWPPIPVIYSRLHISPFTVRACPRRHQKQVPRKAPVHRDHPTPAQPLLLARHPHYLAAGCPDA